MFIYVVAPGKRGLMNLTQEGNETFGADFKVRDTVTSVTQEQFISLLGSLVRDQGKSFAIQPLKNSSGLERNENKIQY